MRKKKTKYIQTIFHSAEDILNHLKYDTVYRFDKYTRPEFRGYDYIHQQQKVTWLEGGGVLIENLELTYGEKLFNDIKLVHERKMQFSDFIRKWYVEQYDDTFRYKIIHNETNTSFDIYVDYNLG